MWIMQAGRVIVVVEGPSATGKTTWATQAAPRSLVPEAANLQAPGGSHDAVAAFWTEANERRWGAAIRMEAATGAAVCDTDPLKLHYPFCLYRIGRLAAGQLQSDIRAARDALSDRRVGIADLVLCEVPDADVLERQRRGDSGSGRRNFELHRRLGEPLREWYGALAQLSPGRVEWKFPDSLPRAVVRDRYDTELFNAWIAALGLA